jgi:hypothetical protein
MRRRRFKASSAPTLIVLQRHQHVESGAPSTTVRSLRELQWSPSPASRGRMARALSFSRRTRARGLPTKATNSSSPQRNEGRRSAEKAQLSRGATPRIGCCHPNALRARPRAHRSALAFRRSTAALAPANCRSSIQAALHAMQCAGVTFAFGIALKRSTSRAGRNAGGVDARTARERQ